MIQPLLYEPDEMTPMKARFVEEFPKDLDPVEAAKRVGCKTDVAARKFAERAMRDEMVRSKINGALRRRARRVETDQDYVIEKLAQIAGCDLSECYAEDGNLKAIKDIPENTRLAISGMDVEEVKLGDDGSVSRVKKIRTFDKVRALELLGKHLRMFAEVVEVKHDLADRIVQARNRAIEGR